MEPNIWNHTLLVETDQDYLPKIWKHPELSKDSRKNVFLVWTSY